METPWRCGWPGCGRLTDHLILRGGVGVCRECALELEELGPSGLSELLEALLEGRPQEAVA